MIKFTSVAPVMVPQASIEHRSKKDATKQRDFVDSFLPIYYFLRSFGLMPFSIRRNANRNILDPRVDKFDAGWFVMTILIYSLATFVSFEYVKFKPETNTQLNMLVIWTNLHLTLGMVFCVVIIAMDMYNRVKLVNLIKTFTIFDKQVSYSALILIHFM